jgi:hypothetical protein
MKKILLVGIFTFAATAIFAQGGRIRISFAGFECYRETWDDILNSDGKGDEVFFNFSFLLAYKNGNSKLSYEKRTGVYGDATGKFSNRISVGSCVDLFGNLKGGIKAGDVYRCNDVIGEYDMAEADVLTLIPTAWEHDPIADNSISFSSTMKSFYNNINQKIAPIMIGLNVLTGKLGGIIFQTTSLGLSKIKAGGEQGELGKPGTRPIGMEKFGDFTAKLVALNTPNLVSICNSDMGFGKGIIAVNYDEEAVGNLRDHGNYTMLIRVEYFPNQSTANNAPPALPIVNKNIKQVTMSPTLNTVNGTWSGTSGTGQNAAPKFYSFKLNTDGTMQLVDAGGNIIAKGNYTFSNGQLSGTYAYNSNNSPFSFAATLSGTQLNGTWGSGNNTSGGGKWLMNKAALNSTGNIR